MQVTINGPDGPLEGLLDEPDDTSAGRDGGGIRAAVVFGHPHPQHGGTMHTKAVFQGAKGLVRIGCAVLRFNFRGVGRSAGEHDHGRGEQDDVRAALDALRAGFPGLPVLLGGFSFGSVMALRVGVRDPRARSLVALGFPANVLKSTGFLSESTKPRLFVQGEADRFGDASAISALVETLPEPRRLVVVPGADHFFTGHLEAVDAAISDWVPLV